MTLYEFLETLNENDNAMFTLFDCNSEDVVFMATDEAESTCEFNRDDLVYSDYVDYDICSMDMWVEKDGRIHIEFNIEVEEDEDDDEWEEPDLDDDYTSSAENGDYSPSDPWNAPGMKISDFI